MPWWKTVENLDSANVFHDDDITDLGLISGDRVPPITPPRVISILDATESVVFNRRPKFFGKARMASTEKLAEIMEDAINAHWWRDWDVMSQELRIGIRDAGKYGFGHFYTAIETDFEVVERRKRERRERAERIRRDASFALLDDTEFLSQFRDEYEDSEALESTIEGDSRLFMNRIFVVRIPPMDWVQDSRSTALHNASWAGYRFRVYLDVLQSSPLYKNARRVKPTQFDDDPRWSNPGRPAVLCTKIFFRDVKGKVHMRVMAEGHDEWIREVDAPYVGGMPLHELSWRSTGNELFPISDIKPVYPHLVEEQAIRTRFFDAMMREFQDVTVVNGSVVDTTEITQMTEYPGVGLVMSLKKLGDRSIQSVIDRLRKDTKSPELLNYLAIIERDIQSGTKTGPNQQMQALRSDTSASEAMLIQRQYDSLNSAKIAAVNACMARIAAFQFQLMCECYSPEQMGHLAGDKAERYWLTAEFTDFEIQDGLSVTVEPGSMQPESDERRAALYDQMALEAFTYPVAGMTYNVQEIMRRRSRARGIHDGSALLNASMDSNTFADANMKLHLLNGGAASGSPPAQPGRSNAEVGTPA
jgi:hypothetical protein